MCLIIDANVAGKFVSDSPPDEVRLVSRWIDHEAGRIVYCSHLFEELAHNGRFRRWLLERARAGRARKVDEGAVEAEIDVVEGLGACRSNDTHVIALARVSGARLVFSHDKALHHDFKNGTLINGPRGSIFQGVEHHHLLNQIGRRCP